MPPKVRYTKDQILDIAFAYLRKNGWIGLTTKYLSEQLNCSTMPIYSHFESMAHLEKELVKMAMELFFEYMTTQRTGDLWIDNGLGYVLFARKEKHLFRAVFDEMRRPMRKEYDKRIWNQLGQSLTDYPAFQDLSENQLYRLRRVNWVMIHGLACLVNTNQIPTKSEQEIRNAVETCSMLILSGVKATFK